jgi:hypothetical protein
MILLAKLHVDVWEFHFHSNPFVPQKMNIFAISYYWLES